ncbi:hypothetical protein [Mitsuokella jalaludinii]|uniref:hypothetical protein n=1 Tax=Mitsuokella jalaludinii TaxID=187979 RepID=UPI0005629D21|nr:hypothetical protein [Mitsuokella jalaludinii]
MIFSVTDTLTICRHKILCGFRQAFSNTKADSDTIIKCFQIIISLYSSLQLLSRLFIAPGQGLQGFEQSA